ncbi:cupin domain-containing protein [Chitiniphilus eburneus]|uniref:Cupin domain-containing protein n=1 Tax=Chitiniphilus eburneus TaxID=2571148 RepID=A0A4U0Q8K1_9NEIS|nr:cupin domain-containing protein [Chitiniphilus eburneus]TJZ77613.1 cupin domain-containing protein [Chitiniphilus eburneus]
MNNVFADIPQALDEELFQTLTSTPGVRIERIVSTGQVSPDGFWYEQEETEWVLVLEGAARVAFADTPGEMVLGVGDYLLIAPGRRHRVNYTANRTVWLAVWWSGPSWVAEKI